MEALNIRRLINKKLRTTLKYGLIVTFINYHHILGWFWLLVKLRYVFISIITFYYREWGVADVETFFFLTLRQYRLITLKNDKITDYYMWKLREEKVFQTAIKDI